MVRTVTTMEELKSLGGQHLGYSEWHEVTQEMVNKFADATNDHQWIHVDPERAKSGPFGGPIAHGYLTLSLASWLINEVFTIQVGSMGINYGFNKVRFPAPVPVGKRLRLGVNVLEVSDISGGAQQIYELTFEVEGQDKPACVAEWITRTYL